MRNVRLSQLAIGLVIVAAAVASMLVAAAPDADADVFACPGVHNVGLSTRVSPYGVAELDLNWDAELSYHRAALFCPDIIGYDVRDANNDSVYRIEWTALEFVLLREQHPQLGFWVPGTDPAALRHRGCEWSVVLYARSPGEHNSTTYKYTKTEGLDLTGLPGCASLTGAIRQIPQISFAPVVSDNPPSIDP